MTAVLDHLAVAAPVRADGWELFGGDRSAACAVGIEDRTVQVEQGGHVAG